jgi:hypothetical protein
MGTGYGQKKGYCFFVCKTASERTDRSICLDAPVMLRLWTYRVRGPCISCQHKGLASTSAIVVGPAWASATWLTHPILAAKCRERLGISPALLKRTDLHVFETHTRDYACGEARKSGSGWVYRNVSLSRTTHTRFRLGGNVVIPHKGYFHLAAIFFDSVADNSFRQFVRRRLGMSSWRFCAAQP